MADRYIDHDETQIYGPYAARAIRTRIVGLVPAFDAGLEYLADDIEAATTAVAEAMSSARTSDAELRRGVRERGPALKRAQALLARFGKHLDAHEPGTVDKKAFFKKDGTPAGVGSAAARVLLAVSHIGRALKNGAPVRDRDAWMSAFDAVAAELGPVVDHSNSVKCDRGETTLEVEAARHAWMSVYRAARAGVECVLRLRGQLDRLPDIFYDLTAPGDAKVTEPPDPPPLLTTPPPPPVG